MPVTGRVFRRWAHRLASCRYSWMQRPKWMKRESLSSRSKLGSRPAVSAVDGLYETDSTQSYIMQGAWTKQRCIVSFLVCDDQTPYHHNGLSLSPRSMLINPLGAEFYRRSTGRRAASMPLAPDERATAGITLVGKELVVPAATQVVQPPPQLMSRLLHLYEAAEHLAETVPDVLNHPTEKRPSSQNCSASSASWGKTRTGRFT